MSQRPDSAVPSSHPTRSETQQSTDPRSLSASLAAQAAASPAQVPRSESNPSFATQSGGLPPLGEVAGHRPALQQSPEGYAPRSSGVHAILNPVYPPQHALASSNAPQSTDSIPSPFRSQHELHQHRTALEAPGGTRPAGVSALAPSPPVTYPPPRRLSRSSGQIVSPRAPGDSRSSPLSPRVQTSRNIPFPRRSEAGYERTSPTTPRQPGSLLLNMPLAQSQPSAESKTSLRRSMSTSPPSTLSVNRQFDQLSPAELTSSRRTSRSHGVASLSTTVLPEAGPGGQQSTEEGESPQSSTVAEGTPGGYGGYGLIPLDTQSGSKMADEKRKRNAGASARFRARRKEKEREASSRISALQQQIQDLSEDADFYRRERDLLAQIVYHGPERDRHFPRPPSPRRQRNILPSEAGTHGPPPVPRGYNVYSEASDSQAQDRYMKRRLTGYSSSPNLLQASRQSQPPPEFPGALPAPGVPQYPASHTYHPFAGSEPLRPILEPLRASPILPPPSLTQPQPPGSSYHHAQAQYSPRTQDPRWPPVTQSERRR